MMNDNEWVKDNENILVDKTVNSGEVGGGN